MAGPDGPIPVPGPRRRTASAQLAKADPRVWIYPVTIRRWIDGDTAEVDLDKGLRDHYQGPARIAGIDAPERNNPPAWEAARAYAGELCPPGSTWVSRSVALDKYGRPLLEIDLGDGNLVGFAQAMVNAGRARWYRGGLSAQIAQAPEVIT